LKPTSVQTRGLLIALVGIIAWAFTAIFIAYLFERYPLTPFTLTFWRALLMAAAVLVGLGVWQPATLCIGRRDLPFFLACWSPSRCWASGWTAGSGWARG
jgi:hypothetical protein